MRDAEDAAGPIMNCPLDWLLYHGTVSESCFPYVAWDAPCNPNCNPHYKISGWRSITPNTEQAIKVALTRGPIIGTFAVYEDYRYYSGGVYEYTSGGLLGYHAVTIVGWGADSRGTFWICKNSWGKSWGDSGYFKIRSGNCGINDELYELSVEPPIPVAGFTAIPITGILPLTPQFTDVSTSFPSSWEWSFGDGTPNSTLQNPTHTYFGTGKYAVTLTVSNAYGTSTIQKTDYITVLPPPPFLSGWSYRKLHTISSSTSADLTNYQIRFKRSGTPPVQTPVRTCISGLT